MKAKMDTRLQRSGFPNLATPARVTYRPDFEQLMKKLDPIWGRQMLVGYCRDGLPLLLDLDHPQTTPVLIVNSELQSPDNLLKGMILSAMRLNAAVVEGVVVITNCFEKYDFLQQAGMQHVLQLIEDGGVVSLMDAVLQFISHVRGHAQRKMLLVLDDLEALTQELHPEELERLLWIVQQGKTAGVITIAVSRRAAGSQQLAIAFPFGCLINGHAQAVLTACQLAPNNAWPEAEYVSLVSGHLTFFRIPGW